MRKQITLLRRAEVVFAAADLALKRGRAKEAERMLRFLMAETQYADTEREASYLLAQALRAGGDGQRSKALFRDIVLRDPKDHWGVLAKEQLDQDDFRERNARTLARMGLKAP